MGANLVVASKSDTMQACMSKMVARDIRHLPVVDEDTGTVSTHPASAYQYMVPGIIYVLVWCGQGDRRDAAPFVTPSLEVGGSLPTCFSHT